MGHRLFKIAWFYASKDALGLTYRSPLRKPESLAIRHTRFTYFFSKVRTLLEPLRTSTRNRVVAPFCCRSSDFYCSSSSCEIIIATGPTRKVQRHGRHVRLVVFSILYHVLTRRNYEHFIKKRYPLDAYRFSSVQLCKSKQCFAIAFPQPL